MEQQRITKRPVTEPPESDDQVLVRVQAAVTRWRYDERIGGATQVALAAAGDRGLTRSELVEVGAALSIFQTWDLGDLHRHNLVTLVEHQEGQRHVLKRRPWDRPGP